MAQPQSGPPPTGAPAAVRNLRGACYASFAYDIGAAIDLDGAERRLTSAARERMQHRRRAPAHFAIQPAPIRTARAVEPIAIAQCVASPLADVVLYDFGAALVTFQIPLEGALERLLEVSDALYDNPALLVTARSALESILDTIRPAVSRPNISDLVEEYFIFQIETAEPPLTPESLLAEQREFVARVLRSERGRLSADEISDALAVRTSYRPDDLALIDYNAALLLDREAEDVRAVLEFANVELLEMRYLDRQLDAALNRATAGPWTGRLGRLHSTRTAMRRVAEMQMDAARLFEEVNNALKLLGDVYLARVYRLVSQRLHLAEWDASILRKLQALESIYQKISDRQATLRMELLEWIIIILIALSIAVSLIPGFTGH
ncbi:MAG: hypothetical protein LC135_16840 [Phycisphaerae bacterium]|jgi:hypothetical protein|nr:hypothetical protein [Phycisphaerae bacterium]MCZ2401508.1 hypothetical protein [Phycisphaerae bacterium]NUQ49335.1 hypothetical protein [Phycisphaerae bacterium]